MKVRVYRNLDRPLSILGIKGRFIRVAAIWVVVSIVASILIGTVLGGFVGICNAVVALVVGYIALAELQHRFSGNAINRMMVRRNLPKYIVINSKVWKKSI